MPKLAETRATPELQILCVERIWKIVNFILWSLYVAILRLQFFTIREHVQDKHVGRRRSYHKLASNTHWATGSIWNVNCFSEISMETWTVMIWYHTSWSLFYLLYQTKRWRAGDWIMMIQWFNYKEGDGERESEHNLNSPVLKNNLSDSIKTAN